MFLHGEGGLFGRTGMTLSRPNCLEITTARTRRGRRAWLRRLPTPGLLGFPGKGCTMAILTVRRRG
jgi:hypothetical protein